MGRDKSRLRLGLTTMLGTIRKAARATGLPVRIIRRDIVPKCGPLGGIYTALKTTRADAVLFLACDMPLVSAELIQFVLERSSASQVRSPKCVPRASLRAAPILSAAPALFVRSSGRAGFPFLLPSRAFKTVFQQIENDDLSLQSLAKALRATILTLKHPWTRELFNVNTPQDRADLQLHLAR
jgi:molybdopterin-guanine dinucleotide biosynthesis protein A